MAYITSRKHARAPHSLAPTAAALALALPLVAGAQTAPAPAAPVAPAATPTLPEVKVRGAATQNDYKADAVSSPKFTQPLVDTPQTITVIKKEVLQQQGTTSLSEALRNTPGITMQLGENGNSQTGDSIFMRGFDTSSSIFVDGIRDLGAISRDIFNLDAVEIVKGPSGADIGRTNSSGYVNLVSKTPQRERFATGSLTVGTESRVRAAVDLNQPLDLAIPGSALRLNVMAQDYGQPGRDEVKNKRWGIAPSLAFGLGTPTRTTLSYLHLEQDNVPDGGVSTFGLPGYRYAAASGTTPAQLPGPSVDPETFYGVNGDYDKVRLDMVTARFEHDIAPGTTLRNTTRLGRSEQTVVITGVNAVQTPTAAPSSFTITRSRQGRHQNNEILANQTNLSTEFSTGPVSHALATGFEFAYERQKTQTPTTGASTAGNSSLYSPSQSAALAGPVYNGSFTDGNTLSAAVYAFDTLKLSEQWQLNAGLRWEKYRTQTDSATFAAPTLTQNPALGISDSLLTWKAGALFKPAANGSVYVSYATSAQPPGGTNFALAASGNSQARADFDAQKGSVVELGTKWDLLDSKLAVTAAVYRAENKNEIVSDGATVPTYSQIGKRRVDGVELGVVGQVTPALNLSAGIAYMDSEILRAAAATTGGVIVFTPKVTFTSWATYKLPAGFTVGGGVRYVDNTARSSNTVVPTTNLYETPDYWVGDLYLGYEFSKNLLFQVNVNNVADKKYMTSLNNGGSRYRPGEARNALLTANVKF